MGWKLRERAARKKVLLELGNAAGDRRGRRGRRDRLAKTAANAFAFAGQSCISVQRVYVARSAHDEFLADFLPGGGAPASATTWPRRTSSPVIDEDAKERILDWIEKRRPRAPSCSPAASRTRRACSRPTVLGDVTPEMKVSCLEVFGPLCTVSPYDSLEEAFKLANGTEYGLQAGVFTGSVKTAMAAGSALEFGGVLVNEAPTFRADQMPRRREGIGEHEGGAALLSARDDRRAARRDRPLTVLAVQGVG